MPQVGSSADQPVGRASVRTARPHMARVREHGQLVLVSNGQRPGPVAPSCIYRSGRSANWASESAEGTPAASSQMREALSRARQSRRPGAAGSVVVLVRQPAGCRGRRGGPLVSCSRSRRAVTATGRPGCRTSLARASVDDAGSAPGALSSGPRGPALQAVRGRDDPVDQSARASPGSWRPEPARHRPGRSSFPRVGELRGPRRPARPAEHVPQRFAVGRIQARVAQRHTGERAVP